MTAEEAEQVLRAHHGPAVRATLLRLSHRNRGGRDRRGRGGPTEFDGRRTGSLRLDWHVSWGSFRHRAGRLRRTGRLDVIFRRIKGAGTIGRRAPSLRRPSLGEESHDRSQDEDEDGEVEEVRREELIEDE